MMRKLGVTRDSRIPPSARRDAIFLLLLFLGNCLMFSSLPGLLTMPWLWLYGLAMLVPLFWRDRWPRTIFATQCLLTIAVWPLLNLYIPMAGIPVALYAISVHCNKRTSLLALLISFIPGALVADIASGLDLAKLDTDTGVSFILNGAFFLLLVGGAWYLGMATRASNQRVLDLEHQKRMERRKIAAELHDSVSHAVTLIILQAAGAARIAKSNLTEGSSATTDLAEVIQALENIQSKGTQAMTELQLLLGVLRDATDDTREPQPGLADLPALLNSLPATESQLILDEKGTPRELSPSVDRAAYRVVQEGLTNIFKHAEEPANPQLRLVWHDDNLLIELDNGTNLAKSNRPQPTSGGRGLVGLRERVDAIGGNLEAGSHDGAGYRLTATLPLATHAGFVPATAARASGRDHGDQVSP